jgi:hypothetical protein
MNKVVCIHKGPWPTYDFNGDLLGNEVAPNPKYLEEVTTIDSMTICGQPCYRLSEYMCDFEGYDLWFEQKYFAVMADISELVEILEHQPETA